MKLKKSILGSKPEERVFKALESRWSSNYKIFPSLQLSSIIRPEPDEITDKELEYFYKSSVDYTLCDSENRPILSIEFDGMGEGFSRDGVYILGRPCSDPMRKIKLDFKLKCADKANYPFFVVSFEETKSLDEEDRLMVLDAIIGQVLARKEFLQKADELASFYQNELDGLEELSRNEFVEDMMTSCEVEAELRMDPIARKAAEYSSLCLELGIKAYRFEFMSDPELPDFKILDDTEGLEARIEAMKRTAREGCRIVIQMPKQQIVQEVWIRNIKGYAVSPYSIARNIAEYLGFKKAYLMLPKATVKRIKHNYI